MKTPTAVVLELYTTFDRGDFNRLQELISHDFMSYMTGLPTALDRDAFISFGLSFRQAFPDGYHQFENTIEQGDKVATQGTFTGTHLGNFQGLPATGKAVKIALMHIDRVVDGKVVVHWGQGDQAGMMQQLGIIFVPGIGLISSALGHRWRTK